jgi:peptide/nickel transport system ATP-binding protein
MTGAPLLHVTDMTIALAATRPVPVVRKLSLTLGPGETLGIVGESGSGKSMTALALMGLTPKAMTVTGSIRFEGRELLPYDEARMIGLRGKSIAMIFQEPMTALNPVHRIGRQIAEGLILHEGVEETAALAMRRRACSTASASSTRASGIGAYPHELSGGSASA